MELVALVQEIMNGRIANPPQGKEDRDMLDVLVSIKDEDGNPRFTANEITGMFISMMFAGHHTTSGTAAWTLIELLRHPEIYADSASTELDELYADGYDVSFDALRQIPQLEAALKETLRLHPPLIILMRVARAISRSRAPIAHGDLVAATPAISNRIAEDFPDPDTFDPDRYIEPDQEDLVNRWTWIPFGAGAPLRRRGVRPDAAQGDLLDSAAGLGIRARATLRDLPQRPQQDGRAAAQPGKVRYRKRRVRGHEVM